MEKDLKSQERALTDDINSLGKKVTSLLLTAEFIEPDTRPNIWRSNSMMRSRSYVTS
jgi:hypothetical protein